MHDYYDFISRDPVDSGPFGHVAISSRARLARNIFDLPFPHRMFREDTAPVEDSITRFAAESCFGDHVTIYWMKDLSPLEKRLMREVNLITSEMETSALSGVAFDRTNGFSILVNEEDHLRIQVILQGLQVMEAFRKADMVDDELNRFAAYSFDNELGYLTACTSNLGTALRVSVLLHLPVLTMRNRVPELVPDSGKKSVEIRGTLNSGRKSAGAIYQVSNRQSLGLSEIDIIDILDEFVASVIEQEDAERDRYFNDRRLEVEDRVWRSFGTLLHARSISYAEAMDLLSSLRLGVVLAVVKNLDIRFIDRLMVGIQLAHLQEWAGSAFLKPQETDVCRANYIRETLGDFEVM